MPTFDIVSKVDGQALDNAVNNARKELVTRYDFQGSKTSIELDKKSNSITIVTEDDLRLKHVRDMLISRMMKQQLDPKSLDFGKEHYAAGNMIRKEVTVKQGIDKETAKQVVAKIKANKIKVQASIMDDQVRVQGKKIDDLQEVITLLRNEDFGQPLQFDNMRS